MRLADVRHAMPVRPGATLARRVGEVHGIAIHHSATANVANGLSLDTARSIFEYQVWSRGWAHGGYHYLVRPNGLVEYALDEAVPGYHAGFVDPDDEFGLHHGQYWNEHYLAVCVLGWFESGRRLGGILIPDRFVRPTDVQWRALVELVTDLRTRYGLSPDSVRGHCELAGCVTRCPGEHLDLDALRATQE